MPVCPHCGKLIRFDSKYCGQCGKPVHLEEEYQPTPPPPVESEKKDLDSTGAASVIEEVISEGPELSSAGVESFLGFEERIIFRTKGQVWFRDHRGYAYVTNNRILFYYREPKLKGSIQEDELDEIYPNSVKKISLVESGLIVKKITLRMDGYEIGGDRGDLIGLYKAIKSVRGQA